MDYCSRLLLLYEHFTCCKALSIIVMCYHTSLSVLILTHVVQLYSTAGFVVNCYKFSIPYTR